MLTSDDDYVYVYWNIHAEVRRCILGVWTGGTHSFAAIAIHPMIGPAQYTDSITLCHRNRVRRLTNEQYIELKLTNGLTPRRLMNYDSL